MKNGRLKLGIVGGLGARGGADILNKLVADTPVKSESDHRDILFEQKPLTETVPVSSPDYSPAHRKFYVFDTLARMEQNGCGAALLPCFITHTFLEELEAELPIELISIGDAIVEALQTSSQRTRRIGVLTTPFVRQNGFFERLLGDAHEVVFPNETAEKAMLDAIYGQRGFKAGRSAHEVRQEIEPAVQSLAAQDVDLILPGMTELPIIFGTGTAQSNPEIIDVNAVYARYALRRTSTQRKTTFKVGVVGGVGPAATVDFLKKIVLATDAERDQDHIKLVVEQNPQIPDRTESLVNEGPDPTLALYATCKKLERAGAQIITIPCNTAHAYVDRIQRHLDVPIMNILTEAARYVATLRPEIRKVAILATNGTIASQLYQTALRAQGLDPIIPLPSDQDRIMDAIYGSTGVKAGFYAGSCSEQLGKVIMNVTTQGAEAAILGCTELPLIELTGDHVPKIPLIDPTEVLAQACVAAASV